MKILGPSLFGPLYSLKHGTGSTNSKWTCYFLRCKLSGQLLDLDAIIRANVSRIDPSKLPQHITMMHELYRTYKHRVCNSYVGGLKTGQIDMLTLFDELKEVLDKHVPPRMCFISGSAALAKYCPDLGVRPGDIDLFLPSGDSRYATRHVIFKVIEDHFSKLGKIANMNMRCYKANYLFQLGPIQIILMTTTELNFDIPALEIKYWNGISMPELPPSFDPTFKTPIIDLRMTPDRYMKYRNIFVIPSFTPVLDILTFTPDNYDEMIEYVRAGNPDECVVAKFKNCDQETIDKTLAMLPNTKYVTLHECSDISLTRYRISAIECSYCTFDAVLCSIHDSHHCTIRIQNVDHNDYRIRDHLFVTNCYAIGFQGRKQTTCTNSQAYSADGKRRNIYTEPFYTECDD